MELPNKQSTKMACYTFNWRSVYMFSYLIRFYSYCYILFQVFCKNAWWQDSSFSSFYSPFWNAVSILHFFRIKAKSIYYKNNIFKKRAFCLFHFSLQLLYKMYQYFQVIMKIKVNNGQIPNIFFNSERSSTLANF